MVTNTIERMLDLRYCRLDRVHADLDGEGHASCSLTVVVNIQLEVRFNWPGSSIGYACVPRGRSQIIWTPQRIENLMAPSSS